jgi:hypothetical protein
MPLAGRDPSDRAHAHYRWAQRYADEGDIERAIPHFGRALYYGERTNGGNGANGASSLFGTGEEDDGTDTTVPNAQKVTDLVSFAGLFYVDLPEEEARALASELVAKCPAVGYTWYSTQMPNLQKGFDDLMHEKHPDITRSSGVYCYYPRCQTTPMEKLNTPDGDQVFCRRHAADVRYNAERTARQKR